MNSTNAKGLTIVVPVFNELNQINTFLNHLTELQPKFPLEVIFVDGGSLDGTYEALLQLTANSSVVSALRSPKGRGVQIQSGVEAATYELTLVLHIDTQLNQSALDALGHSMNNQVSWGRFDLRLTGNHFMFRIIERLINLRSRLSSISTGDQGQFFQKELFLSLGSFKDYPFMEDLEICYRLKKKGIKPANLKQKVETSSRRWEEKGIFKTIWTMWTLRYLFYRGYTPKSLIDRYS